LTVRKSLISSLPTASDAINYRYGELLPPPVELFIEWYMSSLEIIDVCANELPRGFFGEHATITVQALPWHPSRRSDRESGQSNP
jgi:hypothetical protein